MTRSRKEVLEDSKPDPVAVAERELAKQEGGPRLVKRGEVMVDQALPTMEDVVDQDLLDQAGRYLASKADFKRSSEIVTQDKDMLFEMMNQRQIETYEHGGIRISIVKTTKRAIKVETFVDVTSDESVGESEDDSDE